MSHERGPATSARTTDQWAQVIRTQLVQTDQRSHVTKQPSASALHPPLSYGRHRGPARSSSHEAAVAIVLDPWHGSWRIPLLLRPSRMRHHPGQIALPGGRLQSGESFEQAGERELREELGLDQAVLEFLGPLSDRYVYASDHLVRPLVFISHQPLHYSPHCDEVAALLFFQQAQWLSDSCRQSRLLEDRPWTGAIPGINLEGFFIWGATAMILEDWVAAYTQSEALLDRLPVE
jgi:8-oxo-dGTP pyrophosphatase MutT (NUDIX family)